jgi:ribosomal protein S13
MLIQNTKCNPRKPLLYGLKAIYGLSDNTNLKICATLGLNARAKINAINSNGIETIRFLRESAPNKTRIFSKLNTKKNIQRLIAIKHYRGVKHMFRVPRR